MVWTVFQRCEWPLLALSVGYSVMIGARLRGWLACGGFQTLLVLMILSAGQQKVTPVAGSDCHSVGVASAGWLESGSECRCVRRGEIEEAHVDGKWGSLALPMFRQ